MNALGNNGGRLYSFGSQPVLIDCNFIVDSSNANGLGVSSLQGQGVQAVYMHTSQTPAAGNPNPASGYALIHLSSSYNRFLGQFSGAVAPVSASNVAINASALTAGNPYIITSVGHGPAGSCTIAPVADVSGSLASTYFTLYDAYGNVFVIWFYVTGVGGSQPQLGRAVLPGQRGLQYVQQTIPVNETASNIGTALVSTINLLPSGIQGVASFTAAGTTTVTCTSTSNNPLAGVPIDGSSQISASNSLQVPIIFTISSGSATAASVWTDGFGNLYTVSTTVASGTTLRVNGVQLPGAASGTLTYVSGPGSTTSLTYSSAVAGYQTGFTFALVNYNTNLACWRGVGLPSGINPAVNASFIATSTGVSTGGGSTGLVKVPGSSGISRVEVVGDANQTLYPSPSGPSANIGSWLLVQFLAATSASVTTLVPAAPTDGAKVYMSFMVDAKSSPSNISNH
jgi:hypothetical protein